MKNKLIINFVNFDIFRLFIMVNLIDETGKIIENFEIAKETNKKEIEYKTYIERETEWLDEVDVEDKEMLNRLKAIYEDVKNCLTKKYEE